MLSVHAEMVAAHVARRQRLLYPPNAVPDTGIDLRPQRPRPLMPGEPRPTPSQLAQAAAERLAAERAAAVPLPPKPEPPPPTASLAEKMQIVAATPWARAGRGRGFSVNTIQHAVGLHFGVPRSILKSASQKLTVVIPRQVAMYIAKAHTELSLPEIGRQFGGRDHTTVLHAVRKIRSQVCAGYKVATDVMAIAEALAAVEILAPDRHQVADAEPLSADHVVEPQRSRGPNYLRCKCGCRQKAKFMATLNGACIMEGCETSAHSFVRDRSRTEAMR